MAALEPLDPLSNYCIPYMLLEFITMRNRMDTRRMRPKGQNKQKRVYC
jgi:hypothetical protein